MTDNTNNFINLAEIQHIARYCANILSYTGRLREDAEMREVYDSAAKELFPSIRKLLISSLMHEKTLICISGIQGAGKTTLIKNFYGLDKYLGPNLGRGERLPVLITEKKDAIDVSGYAMRIDEDEEGNYSWVERELSEEEFATAVKGEDTRIMYLGLRVPFRHIHQEDISFMLLPGYEKNERGNKYWNDLIEFSVNSSSAAVFVFNNTSFSDRDNYDRLREVKNRFGENMVYAITYSESAPDDNAEVKKTCLEVLSIPASEEDRIVCTGTYADQSKNEKWIQALKDALEDYVYKSSAKRVEKNTEYLRRELDEISNSLYRIKDALEGVEETIQIHDYHNHELLKAFDETVEKQRKRIEKNIEKQFKIAKVESTDKLRQKCQNQPKTKLMKRLFIGDSLKQHDEMRDLIKESLQDDEKHSLPDKHMVKALQGVLTALDAPPQTGTNALARLVGGDIVLDNEGKNVLTAGENLKALASDMRTLLPANPQQGQSTALQCPDPKRLMRSIAEISTYLFSMNSYDEVARTVGLGVYNPPEIPNVPKDMISGAESSRNFVLGMAGVMGVDILGDGTLNLVSQIGSSLGVAVPVAGAAAVIIVAAGASISLLRDLTRMQRDDFFSASLTVDETYDRIRLDALERFDECMARVRDRIEGNIDFVHQNGKQVISLFNAQREIVLALNLLDSILDKTRQDIIGQGRWG